MKRAVALLASIGTAATLATACTPPHDTGMDGPCQHKYFSVELAVVDRLGNVASRLTMTDDICTLPNGFLVSNFASQEQHNIGLYNLIDGGNLEEHPLNDGYGPTGGWVPDKITTVHWNMDLLYGILGHGVRIGEGQCTLKIALWSFVNDYQIHWYQGWCDKFASRMGG